MPITWHVTRCNQKFCKITSWISINPINIYKLNWEDYPNSPFFWLNQWFGTTNVGGLDKHLSEWCFFFSIFCWVFFELNIWTSKKASFRQLATSPAHISLQTFAGCQSSFAQRRWETWETQLGHTVIQDFNPGLKIQDVGSWIQSKFPQVRAKWIVLKYNEYIYIYIIYIHAYIYGTPSENSKKQPKQRPQNMQK